MTDAMKLADLPPWEDADVQRVYALLTDPEMCGWTNREEHWEGWLSRNIVAALRAAPQPSDVRERDDLIRLLRGHLAIGGHDAWEGHYYHVVGIEAAADAIIAASLSTPTPAPAVTWDVKIQARKIGQSEWTDIFPAQVRSFSKLGYEIRASETPAPAGRADRIIKD